MANTARFRFTLVAIWLAGYISGLLYSYSHSIPLPIAIPVIAAFLVEVSLYAVPGFPGVRAALEKRYSRPALAGLMAASAAVPYLIYSLPTGVFDWRGLGLLAGLAAALSFFYVVMPKRPVSDLLFVALVAAVILSRLLRDIYPSPTPRAGVEALGQLMWIRLGVFAALSLRHAEGTGFGFVPSWRDWRIGLLHYLLFLPLGVLLGLTIGFSRFDPHPDSSLLFLGKAVLTFVGMLWVVALSEEFFFRGLVQRWLSEWTGRPGTALVATSVLFGAAHLPFREFPNWRFALLAAVAGFFYGRAFLKAGSIRAAMVAHALVNTTWRLLFA